MKIAAYIRNQFIEDIKTIHTNTTEEGLKALQGKRGAELYRAWVAFRRNYYGEGDFNIFTDGEFELKNINEAREAGYIIHLDGHELGTFKVTDKGHNAIYKAFKSWVI